MRDEEAEMIVVSKAMRRCRMYQRILVKQIFKMGCGGVNWIELARDRIPCRALVNIMLLPWIP